MALSASFKDLCAVAPVPVQPLSKSRLGDGLPPRQSSDAAHKPSRGQELLQEKFNIKARAAAAARPAALHLPPPPAAAAAAAARRASKKSLKMPAAR